MNAMKSYSVTLPLVGLISGTRALAGAGLALALSEKIPPAQRRAIGWTIFGIGLATTIPLFLLVLKSPTTCPAPDAPLD